MFSPGLGVQHFGDPVTVQLRSFAWLSIGIAVRLYCLRKGGVDKESCKSKVPGNSEVGERSEGRPDRSKNLSKEK